MNVASRDRDETRFVRAQGKALTNCIGNGVGTMVIARWQGELDEQCFHAALDDPSLAEPTLGPVSSPDIVTEPATQPAPCPAGGDVLGQRASTGASPLRV